MSQFILNEYVLIIGLCKYKSIITPINSFKILKRNRNKQQIKKVIYHHQSIDSTYSTRIETELKKRESFMYFNKSIGSADSNRIVIKRKSQ